MFLRSNLECAARLCLYAEGSSTISKKTGNPFQDSRSFADKPEQFSGGEAGISIFHIINCNYKIKLYIKILVPPKIPPKLLVVSGQREPSLDNFSKWALSSWH